MPHMWCQCMYRIISYYDVYCIPVQRGFDYFGLCLCSSFSSGIHRDLAMKFRGLLDLEPLNPETKTWPV